MSLPYRRAYSRGSVHHALTSRCSWRNQGASVGLLQEPRAWMTRRNHEVPSSLASPGLSELSQDPSPCFRIPMGLDARRPATALHPIITRSWSRSRWIPIHTGRFLHHIISRSPHHRLQNWPLGCSKSALDRATEDLWIPLTPGLEASRSIARTGSSAPHRPACLSARSLTRPVTRR